MAKTVTRRKVLNLRSVFYGVVKTHVLYGFYSARNFLGSWIIAFFRRALERKLSSWLTTTLIFICTETNYIFCTWGSQYCSWIACKRKNYHQYTVDSWYFLKQKEPAIRNKTRRFWQKKKIQKTLLWPPMWNAISSRRFSLAVAFIVRA